MRAASEILRRSAPALECDGEMLADVALSPEIRATQHPDSTLKGEANLLVMPNLDAANISFNLLKAAISDAANVGPILLGPAKPVHIVTTSTTTRRLVNITALAVVDAATLRG
jgi:malate dehydrogenase (oxaloacetate-decarboxylating)(NADP+)